MFNAAIRCNTVSITLATLISIVFRQHEMNRNSVLIENIAVSARKMPVINYYLFQLVFFRSKDR
ncbi:hypothetical protein A359_03960 [secondary endosymbiont of Ctenarytaina eucalypti]|uniref:Uncharacterized protein n=1 Tax=secondary endosymbiont of Ctenarytaina eucalypti TaxID=1199245 RepID=J3Z3H6_9ENTR|nr:hypothetical protein A359_03960 [secondary endosymbiont of Ctenarytaina eucalypti]